MKQYNLTLNYVLNGMLCSWSGFTVVAAGLAEAMKLGDETITAMFPGAKAITINAVVMAIESQW